MSDVLTTDQNERDLHNCKLLDAGCLKASRRGDPRRKVNRLDIQNPRRVGGHRMKVEMAKAYRVGPLAVECFKVETNIVDTNEAAPESETGRL